MNGRAIVLRGDAASLPLPDESVDLLVTSPPYFSLRSYTDGGKPYDGQIGSEYTPWQYLEALWRCTREWMRVLKPEGSLFVVLGDKYSTYTGANWGNGRSLDGYRGQAKVPHGGPVNAPEVYGIPYKSLMGLPWRYAVGCIGGGSALADPDVVKLLLRDVALGVCTLAEAEELVDELAATPDPGLGLILRAEVVWSKPSSMPESITDRVRRSHEQVFHFTKSGRYFSAVDEIREPHTMRPQRRPNGRPEDRTPRPGQPRQSWPTARRDEVGVDGHPLGKLPGSVWEITSEPLKVPPELGVDHFAAYPTAMVRRIILGWSPTGICVECGEGRRPVTRREVIPLRPNDRPGRAGLNQDAAHGTDRRAGTHKLSQSTITGYACACTPFTDHPGTGETARRRDYNPGPEGYSPQGTYGQKQAGEYERVGPWREYHLEGWTPPPTRPAVVVDPFGGTGTTALVASVLGRTGVTIDRSADYCRLARWRTSDPGERARALGVPKPPPVPDGQGSLFDQFGEAS